ncbi:MAG: polyisoprenoid-binding protein [Kangiellaceae bacterium]|nr:polyisoprenoid-binding protein [Kangiellaceae bacterium]
MIKTTISALVLASALALSGQTKADNVNYELETIHSQIVFKINHLGFSNSYGKFKKFDGTVSFDADNWETASTNVTIETKSIDLENKKWNEHMRSADFFNVEEFPSMTFNSTKLEKTDENKGLLHGDLTILGKTLPVTLDLVLNQVGEHPFSGKPHIGFSASGMIKRSEFGMETYVPAVADEVYINIEVEATVPKK